MDSEAGWLALVAGVGVTMGIGNKKKAGTNGRMQRKNRETDADAPLYSILVIGHWWCCAKSRSSCAGVSLVSLVVVDGTTKYNN